MLKFYRVKQDTFLWDKGAILKHNKSQELDRVACKNLPLFIQP
jgi:hypothetical protein